MNFAILRKPAVRIYVEACAAVALVAYLTGWNNYDLAGFFATWGRAVLIFGPAVAYHKYLIDNGPFNALMLCVPASIESILHLRNSPFDPLLFKAIPLLGLFASPFIVRALLLTVNVAVPFRWLIFALVMNPALLYITAVWGQNDVLLFDFAGGAALLFLTGRPGLAALAFTLDVMIKPTPIVALPIIVVLALRAGAPMRIVLGIAAGLLVALPEVAVYGPRWLPDLYAYASQEYPYSSVGAGTLAAILTGPGTDKELAPDAHHALGIILVALASLALMAAALRDGDFRRRASWYLATCSTAVYWLAPRMHERYLTIGAIFAIVWAFGARTKRATLAAVILNGALLYQVFGYGLIHLAWRQAVIGWMLTLLPQVVWFGVMGALNVAGLLALIASGLRSPLRRHERVRAVA